MSTPSTTAQKVFDYAMQIIDSVNESTGGSDIEDNSVYKLRAVGLINILAGKLYPYSDNYTVLVAGTRPIFPAVAALTDVVQLDDYICTSVLPYGLASRLVMGEDQVLANVCEQLFEDALADLKLGVPAESEAITDVYGVGTEYNYFSAW